MLILIPTLVFWISNPNFLFGQIWAKKVKVVRFNWKLTHMVSWKCRFRIPNLGQKIKNWPFWLKIGIYGILQVLIPNPDLDFWNSDPKFHFWANLSRKSQSCPFFLKIGTHGLLTMLIFVPTLVFWISDSKSVFWQIWAKKVKVVQFDWKLAHRVSRHCWFLFWHYFSQFPTLDIFLDKFGPKNSKLFILTNNWHTWYIENADSYSDNSFLNCQP